MRTDFLPLVTCGLLATVLAAGCRTRQPDALVAQTAGPIAVTVAPVQGRDEPVTVEATGSFQADEASDVAPETSGRVVATPVDVGQFVRQGAMLVRIQGVDANLRLDEARAAAQRAEASVRLSESQNQLADRTAERYQTLLASGDVSRTVADQAKTESETSAQTVATARASLAEARAQLALAEKVASDVAVIAPFSGYISARQVSLGEYVQPSTPVVTLLKVDPLRLLLTIPSIQAGEVRRGQTVTATVDSFPGETFSGTITAVNPAVAAESRSLSVEARVPNKDARLKPGMFAVARIDQGRTSRAVVVPRQAVIEDVNTNSYRVYVIDDQQLARLRVVQLAQRQEATTVRLLAGVKEGERVAMSNLGELYDGAQVTLSGTAKPAAGTPGASGAAGPPAASSPAASQPPAARGARSR